MLVKKYGIPKETAPILFGLPYIISACTSPFLGFMIDRVGKRVHIVIIANIILALGHLITMLLPSCDGCYT